MSDETKQDRKGLYLLHIDGGERALSARWAGVRSGLCSRNRMAPPSRAPSCPSA